MRQFFSITWSLILAISVHVLMAVLVVLGTMDWKPFRPPALTGMTIEAVMVDTQALRQRREQAIKEAEQAVARESERERRQKELEARKERMEREKREAEAAEQKRVKDLAAQKREEDLRLQRMRAQQDKDRKERLKKQQDELDKIRQQREEATRQRRIEEERLKQLDARRKAEADAQRQAQAEADLQQQIANEQAQFRAGQIATKGEAYYAAIQAQVTLGWRRPPTARPGLRCRLRIIQIPGGEVISAAIAGTCNADEATRRSLLAAVERGGALPYRGFEEVFEREIEFIFTYDEN